jgi:hypothetical protein
MTFQATRAEMAMDCQKEKKRMPLTQRNLGVGRNGLTLSNASEKDG